MQKILPLIAAMALLLLPGCLKQVFREAEPRLELNREEVTVRAKSGKGVVTDTLYVSANRSWSVATEGEIEWLSVASEGFENPSEVLKRVPLVVMCKENPELDARNGAIVIIGAGQKKTVTVNQLGILQIDGFDSGGIDPRYFEDYGRI